MLKVAVLVVVCLSQIRCQSTVDPEILKEIFKDPYTPAVTTSPRLEDITVKPTQANTIHQTSDGGQCKCVPYYLCDANRVITHIRNASVTGWGQLDVRFGEDRKCLESVELCCTMPAETTSELPPHPNTYKGCGYRNVNGLDVSITGGSGSEAGFGEFPWVVALLGPEDQYIGVGVLIHPGVVMTGAHVVLNYTSAQLKIRAGEWDTQTTKERLPYQERGVQEMYTHEDFHTKNLFNDIALLKLDVPVNVTDHVNVICLPEQDAVFEDNRNCIANGWGKDVFGQAGRYAVILKKIEVDMMTHSTCLNRMRSTRLGPKFQLHPSFVCAGGEEGKDTCQGDGGAPLACPVGDDRYTLTGLVSWGIGCGGKGVPGVYTKTSMFRNWIDQKMDEWQYIII